MARKSKNKAKAGKKDARSTPWFRGVLYRCLWLLLKGFIILVCISTMFVLLFRFINPPINYYIASEWYRLGTVQRDWVAIDDFQPHVARSVVAAEDANFCLHSGFDLESIRAALKDKSRLRGASTISQQVSKNVFLWQGRSWVRKGLEAGFTVLIELLWSKERILEVYLNVAEFDEGVFGAAAAGLHYFGVEPDQITRLQAARLAAVLPNPKERSASRPTAYIKERTRQILSGEETIAADGRANCF